MAMDRQEVLRRAAWLQGRGPEYERYMVANESDQAKTALINEQREQQRKEQHKEALYADLTSMKNIIASAGDGPVPLEPIKQILRERIDVQQRFGTPYPGNESLENLQKLESGDPEQIGSAIADIQQGWVMADRGMKDKMQARRAFGGGKEREIFSPDVYNSGHILQPGKDGSLELVAPSGKVLTPADGEKWQEEMAIATQSGVQYAADKQEAVRDVDLRYAGPEAYNKALAASNLKRSDDMFSKAEQARGQILNLDKAIAALEGGADTGLIKQYMPAYKDSTRVLRETARRMGLDVVSSVTFGALSKGELDLAMTTAIDMGMRPELLAKQLRERRAAQFKLVEYLENGANYFASPNATKEGLEEYLKGIYSKDSSDDPLGLRQ